LAGNADRQGPEPKDHIADGDLAFFTTWCPAAPSIETLVAVEGPSVGDRGQF
jgi:SRSO17 transposase